MAVKNSIAFFLTVLVSLQSSKLSSSSLCRENERQALLDFKQGVTDSTKRLSSWFGSDCCTKWEGVGCDHNTGHVIKLDLHNPISIHVDEYFDTVMGSQEVANAYFKAKLVVRQVNSSLIELNQLRYLDLSANTWENFTKFPDIGSFHEVRYLNLSLTRFGAYHYQLPNWWQTLKNLETLDLSYKYGARQFPTSIGALPMLKELHIHHAKFEGRIPTFVSKNLEILDLSHNLLSGPIPKSLGELTTLKKLLLNKNSLSGSIPKSLGNLSSLEALILSENQLSSQIPLSLGGLSSLKELDLSINQLRGQVLLCFERMTNLTFLNLGGNQFTGEIPVSIEKLTNLVHLDLSYNNFGGQIPINLGTTATKLVGLYLRSNQLNGTVPVSLGQLSEVTQFHLSNNSLRGEITEMHFAKLSKVSDFSIKLNPLLSFKMRDGWVLPFTEIWDLDFRGCHVGPQFPKWIQSQTQLRFLSMPDSGITDSIPKRFFENMTQLNIVNLSRNQIRGKVPDFVMSMMPTNYGSDGAILDLGSNQFEGPLPNFSSNISFLTLSNNNITGSLSDIVVPGVFFLDISNNHISGSIPSSLCGVGILGFLDLSKNQFSGSLPHCLGNLELLEYLDLSSNNLSGSIPASIGHLQDLSLLRLSNNFFSGEMPSTMRNCKKLSILDLGENSLSGELPAWIGGSLTSLRILRLIRNKYSGGLSPKLCSLDQIQILNLAHNNFSGTVSPCFGNLKAMIFGPSDFPGDYVEENAKISEEINGRKQEYGNTLKYLVNLDLSSNNLVGQIPDSLSNLSLLLGLNLAENHFTGNIPHNIGNMSSLLSLDISQNNLSGEIPSSISSLSKLSHLNLSNNHLSGAIPSGGQLQTLIDPSIYKGNNLCGFPLERCSDNKQLPPPPQTIDKKDESDSKFFYFGLLSGFIVGMWIVFCIMLFKKTWRYTYFRFVDDIKTKLLVAVETRIARARD